MGKAIKSFSERISTGGKSIFQQVIGPTSPSLAKSPETDTKRFKRQIVQVKKFNPYASDIRISQAIDKARARKSMTSTDIKILHSGWPHIIKKNGARDPARAGVEIHNLYPENIQAAGRESGSTGGARRGG